jgi:predicted dehydrogenase
MQKQNEVLWGVMGCGHIAKTFMQSMKAVKGAKVQACAARHIARAKAFAHDHSIEEHYGNYADMLSQRAIHAVYIASTHNFHFEQIMLCLKHGKHVLCEKPLTLNASQAAQAFALAEQNNLLLIEAVWTRFMPAIQSLEACLAGGEIGEVLGLHCNFSLNRELPDSHRLRDINLAGGALLDLGIYPITMADIVFAAEPEKITSSIVQSSTGVDQNSFYTLEYAGGKTAQLSAGFRMTGPTFALIMGDKGQIEVPFFLGAKEYTVTLEGEQPRTITKDYPEGHNFTFEIQHMTDCLLAGSAISNIMPSTKTMRVMTIMDKIRKQWGLQYPAER